MSITPECVKGGISITWKIQNFHSIYNKFMTEFPIEWPKTKNRWDVQITIGTRNENKTYIHMNIVNRQDVISPTYLSGTIAAVNGKFSLPLNRFDRHNFLTKKNFRIILTPLEGICLEKQCLVDDDILILHINLWNPNINNLIAAEYSVRSTNIQQMCCFHFPLRGGRDWNRNGDYEECSKDVPMEFTDISNNQKVNLSFNLQIEDQKLLVNIVAKDMESKVYFIEGRYRLKIEKKEKDNEVLVDSKWMRIRLQGNQNYFQRLIAEKTWSYRSTEWDVKVEIIIESDRRSVIERINYEPVSHSLDNKQEIPERNLTSFETNDTLQDSMHNLYREGKFCDIMLCVDNETFPCHKVVLCARSPVFRAMFEANMIENELHFVNIDDVESQTIRLFLSYLYSNKVEDGSFDSVAKLYAVADKYDVSNLQKKCANLIVSNLSTESACDALDLADAHQDENLKKEITSYFCDHAKEILNSAHWQSLLSNKPLLAAKIAQDVLNKVL